MKLEVSMDAIGRADQRAAPSFAAQAVTKS
jgi:hypothetical protein